jgi:hypothetical protein
MAKDEVSAGLLRGAKKAAQPLKIFRIGGCATRVQHVFSLDMPSLAQHSELCVGQLKRWWR